MKLHEIPSANFDLRGQSLREQMIARLRQIDDDFHRQSELDSMSDYALLYAYETTLTLIGYRTSSDHYNDGFSYGHEVGRKYEQNMSNTTQG